MCAMVFDAAVNAKSIFANNAPINYNNMGAQCSPATMVSIGIEKEKVKFSSAATRQ